MKEPAFWQSKNLISLVLMPLSLIYRAASYFKKSNAIKKLQKNLSTQVITVPIIIVGNINLGGTGKTPVTLALIDYLTQSGFVVGLVSRGYRRKNTQLVYATSVSHIDDLGDEPYLIYQRTQIPMVIYHDRHKAVQALLTHQPNLDVIISDDGLQHYALKRDIEIAVIGTQRFGNGFIFPSGPLREPISRLKTVDYILSRLADPLAGLSQDLQQLLASKTFFLEQNITDIYALNSPHIKLTITEFKEINNIAIDQRNVIAIAGIAFPENFFKMLKALGLIRELEQTRAFPDHHSFQKTDFEASCFMEHNATNNLFCLMTEKDAVKCQHLGLKNAWVIPLNTKLPSIFLAACKAKIRQNAHQ